MFPLSGSLNQSQKRGSFRRNIFMGIARRGLIVDHQPVPGRYARYRLPPRPPDMSKSPLTCVYHHIVLLIILVSCFGPLQTSAQSTASTSSPSSSTFAASPQSTIIISGLPSLLNLPYLNSTNPTIQIELPTTSPIFITLNICSVGTNVSLLPTVLLSTASPPVFSLGTRSVVDRESGGLAVPNKRNRAAIPGSWSGMLDSRIGHGQVQKLE